MSEGMQDQQQIEDEAFAAEMADGEPPAPVEDAEPEAAEVEHQERHEVIAGYTEDEIRAALEKAKETDALRADLAQVRKALETTNGTYGNKLAQLQQSVASLSQGSEFSPEDFEDLARVLDMPELTEAMVKGLNKRRKPAQAETAPQINPEAIDRLVTERVKQVEERVIQSEQNAEIKALTRVHPDWKDVAQSPDFSQWAQSTLTPQQFHELNNSWDADLVSSRLSEFKAHRDKQHKAAQAVHGRAAAAVVHRGIGSAKQHKSATDEEEEAFRREMASGF